MKYGLLSLMMFSFLLVASSENNERKKLQETPVGELVAPNLVDKLCSFLDDSQGETGLVVFSRQQDGNYVKGRIQSIQKFRGKFLGDTEIKEHAFALVALSGSKEVLAKVTELAVLKPKE